MGRLLESIEPRIEPGSVTELQWKNMGAPTVGQIRFGGKILSVDIDKSIVNYKVCMSYRYCHQCSERNNCLIKEIRSPNLL